MSEPDLDRELEALGAALRAIPTPMAPAGLAERARVRAMAEWRTQDDRRWDELMLAVLALFAWTVGFTAWALFQWLRGGVVAVLDVGFLDLAKSVTVFTLVAWTTAGVAAVVLGLHRNLARRNV